jgi:hypothetical protein
MVSMLFLQICTASLLVVGYEDERGTSLSVAARASGLTIGST